MERAPFQIEMPALPSGSRSPLNRNTRRCRLKIYIAIIRNTGCELNYFYVRRRRTLLSLLDFETNAVSFMKSLETGPADTGMMYEHITSTFLLYKSVPLTFIEPFNDSICHNGTLLSFEDYFCFYL
jgi:hypothetical protein